MTEKIFNIFTLTLNKTMDYFQLHQPFSNFQEPALDLLQTLACHFE